MTIGSTPEEVAEKQRLKAEIDAELFPFRVLALGWSGAVMLGEIGCDGQYEAMLKHVAGNGDLPEMLEPDVLPMLQRGAGVERLPTTRRELRMRRNSGNIVHASGWDIRRLEPCDDRGSRMRAEP